MGIPVLEICDLKVDYRGLNASPVNALDGISLRVGAGECVGVLGESGSGKSTLALSLIGVLPQGASFQARVLRFGGLNILATRARELRKIRGGEIAVIFQEPGIALNPFLTVRRQIAEVIRAHRRSRNLSCRAKAMESLEQVFGPSAGRISRAYPHELSGGERQRVSIALALACQPRLIIADEPTSALDSVVQAEILGIFRGLRGRCALIFMTHDARTLPGLADRIIVLRQGRIVSEGDLDQMCNNKLTGYTADLLGAAFDAAPI